MFAIASSSAAVIVSLAAHCPPAPLAVALTLVGDHATVVVSAALDEARRIWAPYGVAIRRVGDGGLTGVLVHVRMAPAPAGAAAGGQALGSIEFHDGAPDPDIHLYPGRAWTLICQSVGAEATGWPVSYRERVLGQVLGRALAHELGHFLLQTPMHSRTGLMRATQPMGDLISGDRSLLVLDAAAAAGLRLRNKCPAPDISPGERTRIPGAER